MIEYPTPYEFHILWFLYPSWSDSLSFVWDGTKTYLWRQTLDMKHQLYYWDAFILLTLFFPLFVSYWFDKTFLFIFKNDHSYSKSTVCAFFLAHPWPWSEIVKFEKNWGQICYCVVTPSIATSSFLTAWKLVFFPRWSWPQFSYGASIPWC